MAIIKIANAKSGKAYGLKAVLDYIQNPDKTENGILISAKDCLQESAFQQMMATKLHFGQTKGRQYVHIIQSFPIDEKLTPELAHSIGKQLLDSFTGYQGMVTTHTDRKHIHNHIVLNSVDQHTGRKWQLSKEQLYGMRQNSDNLCRQSGLSVLDGKGKGWRKYGEYSGDSWKRQLAINVVACLERSRNREEFVHYLHERGIGMESHSQSLVFTMPDGKKCSTRQLMNYGNFSKMNMVLHMEYNEFALRSAGSNSVLMQQAFKAISDIFGQDTDDVARNFCNGHMPRLEGQALIDWIIKKKGSPAQSWDENPQPLEQRQRNLLADIASMMEMKQRDREQNYSTRSNSTLDEDEMEI